MNNMTEDELREALAQRAEEEGMASRLFAPMDRRKHKRMIRKMLENPTYYPAELSLTAEEMAKDWSIQP